MAAPSLRSVALAALCTIATFTDLHTRTVPNWLTLGTAVVGLALITALTPGRLPWTLLWATLPALAMLATVRKDSGHGGGDVKLAVALGVLVNIYVVPIIVAADLLAAGRMRLPGGPDAVPMAPYLATGSALLPLFVCVANL